VLYKTNLIDSQVEKLLAGGGVGCLPSDTIYGLSCQALNSQAVERLKQLKGGRENKPFIILISGYKILNKLSINETQLRSVKKYWPGKLTVICDAPHAPDWLRFGKSTLAIRIPDNPRILGLIDKVGPIISTSANPSGASPAETAEEAYDYFGGKLDFYIDEGRISGLPSTIARLNNGKLEVIRHGAVTLKED
jgi:L-threonylcarbamoyladenylate synthase